jgi:hypothetical protein
MRRAAIGALLVVAGAMATAPAAAQVQRSWNFLTTGNGHGFQVFDTNAGKIVTFLEHPYRYLRPGADPKSDGVGRRNLAWDFYFGVRSPSGAGWLAGAPPASDPGYVDESNVIHAAATVAGVTADSYFFAPFGYEGNALVALLHAPGASAGYALFNFHMGSTAQSDTMPGSDGESVSIDAATKAVIETGPGGGAMVYVPLAAVDHQDCAGVFGKLSAGGDLGDNTTCSGSDVVPGFEKALAADGWWAVAVAYVDDPSTAATTAQALTAWAAGRPPSKILGDAKAEFEAWRKPPPASVKLSPDEQKVWRQGEATLRMGQVREPNITGRVNHGMILASLPPGEWHTGWVRDAEYAIVALARMGHFDEARMALDFLLGADPVGKFKSYVNQVDYRISVVRYFGTGEEQADWSGQPSPNVEIDGWGLVLWAARNYVDASGDVAWLSSTTRRGQKVYDALGQGVAGALAQNLESNGIARADSSIWEVHDDNKKHFAYTTLAAARGFCDMGALAARAGNMADQATYSGLSANARNGFLGSFVDSNGALGGSLEGLQSGTYTDAAVVEVFNWGLLTDYAGATATATLDLLGHLRVDSGGYKRNDDNQSSYDNNEWILIDLRMADALRRAGQADVADGVLAQVVQKAAANFYLLPELFNAVPADGAIGKYTGSIPMVGYGGGAWVLTMLDRAGLFEPGDCGNSVLTDGGVLALDDGGAEGAGGPGANSGPPYVPACPCALGAAPLPTGTALLVALPWLAALVRLARRRPR